MSTIQLSQSARPLEITTPLGPDVLGLRAIHVREQLSAGFTIEAELSSVDPDIKFDDIVGHPVAVRLEVGRDERRYWHGYVARFQTDEDGEHFFHYRAMLVPWLWALTRSADCRIFQNLSVPDIVQQVFRDRGEKDFELRLSGSYAPLEYCVQYRETDFAFVSRLLEREGIAYYAKHDQTKGLLVLGDEKPAYDPAAVAELPYRPGKEATSRGPAITSWIIEHAVQTTQYTLTDYNPLKPKESLLRMAKVDRAHGINDRQMFDFPAACSTPAEAERLARIRLDELQAGAEIVRAQTTNFGLGTGELFSLTEHPRADQNREYLVTSLALDFDAGEFLSDRKTPAVPTCLLTAIPSSQTYRPPRSTPTPVVHGPQPAVVVGPKGEEIHTDEHGRVKVSFFWDREGKADEKSSCWVRVAQGWAGKKMGSFFLPRIGHEVLIEFLEGDPDRPIITGSVHNADNKPPYALPAEGTKLTMKSLTSKGGGGYNEIRFEDKKGDEQILIRGEKNEDIWIKHDALETVGSDRHLVVKRDLLEHVEHDRHEIVDADHKEKIGKDRHLKVVGKEAKAVDGSQSLSVKGDVIEAFKANHSEQTAKDYYLKADNVCIEAMTNLTLKVGQTTVAMEAGGVSIKTSGDVKIEATGPAKIKASGPLNLESAATAEIKSAATTVKGDGAVTIKGGVVTIN